MFSTLRRVFKQTLIYTASSVVVRFSHFIILPYLYKHLSVVEYNLFDRVIVFSTYLTIFTVWGLDNTYARLISAKDENKKNLNLTYIQLSLIQIVAVFCIAFFANQALKFEGSLGAIFVCCLSLTFQNIFLNYLRWNAKVKFYFFSCLFYGVFFPSMVYLLAIMGGVSVEGVFVASLVLNSFLFVAVLLDINVWKKAVSMDFDSVKEMYKHSKYFGLIMSLGSLIFPIERYVLDEFIVKEDVQKYIVHSKLGMFISMVLQSLNSSLAPLLFKSFNKEDANLVLNIQLIYLLFNIVSVLVVFAVSPYITFFITGSWDEYDYSLTIFILSIYLALNLAVISDAEHQSVGEPRVLVFSMIVCLVVIFAGLSLSAEITIYSIPLVLVAAITLKNVLNYNMTSKYVGSLNTLIRNVLFFILPQSFLLFYYF